VTAFVSVSFGGRVYLKTCLLDKLTCADLPSDDVSRPNYNENCCRNLAFTELHKYHILVLDSGVTFRLVTLPFPHGLPRLSRKARELKSAVQPAGHAGKSWMRLPSHCISHQLQSDHAGTAVVEIGIQSCPASRTTRSARRRKSVNLRWRFFSIARQTQNGGLRSVLSPAGVLMKKPGGEGVLREFESGLAHAVKTIGKRDVKVPGFRRLLVLPYFSAGRIVGCRWCRQRRTAAIIHGRFCHWNRRKSLERFGPGSPLILEVQIFRER